MPRRDPVRRTLVTVLGEGTRQSKAWAKSCLDELWEGQPRLARQAVADLYKRLRSKPKREAVRRLAAYLKNKGERMAYPRYRALGLRIGSGPAESACKSSADGRFGQPGMRNGR